VVFVVDINEQILQTLGGLEVKVDRLREDMAEICEFRDEIGKIGKEFQIYKEERRDLPEKLHSVENIAKDTAKDLKMHIETTADIRFKIDRIWGPYTLMQVFSGLMNLAIVIIVLFHDKLGIHFSSP